MICDNCLMPLVGEQFLLSFVFLVKKTTIIVVQVVIIEKRIEKEVSGELIAANWEKLSVTE